MPILGLHTSVQWCTWVCLGTTSVSAPWTFFVTMAIDKAFPRVGRFIGEKKLLQYSKYFPELCPAQGSCQSTVFCQVRVVAAMPQLGETELLLSFPQILHSSEINSQALHQRLALLYSTLLTFTYICVGAWKPVFISRRTFCLYSLYIWWLFDSV